MEPGPSQCSCRLEFDLTPLNAEQAVERTRNSHQNETSGLDLLLGLRSFERLEKLRFLLGQVRRWQDQLKLELDLHWQMQVCSLSSRRRRREQRRRQIAVTVLREAPGVEDGPPRKTAGQGEGSRERTGVN